MKIFFFDTETSGLPKDYKKPFTDTKNWPKPIQIAYIVANVMADRKIIIDHHNCKVISRMDLLEKDYSSDVHNISYERMKKEGVRAEGFYERMMEHFSDCDAIGGHNIGFDRPVIKSDLVRFGMIEKWDEKREFCTMREQAVIDYCRLPGKYGYKWPKLEELYKILFRHDMSKKFNAHDALGDVKATVNCFKRLLDLGLIKI